MSLIAPPLLMLSFLLIVLHPFLCKYSHQGVLVTRHLFIDTLVLPPIVSHLTADGISGVLATVQMHCPDRSPQQMWKCLRQLCEMMADSMVAQVDVKLAEGWFLCWEAMLGLRGTGLKTGLCVSLPVRVLLTIA